MRKIPVDYCNSPKGWTARLIARIKDRAKKRGIPFDLDIDWVRDKINEMRCAVTKIPFDPEFYKSKSGGMPKPFSPSIDRVNPELGYIKSNCRVVCWIYNTAKHDFTDDDVMLLASALIHKIPKPLPIPEPQLTPLVPKDASSHVIVPNEVVKFIRDHGA